MNLINYCQIKESLKILLIGLLIVCAGCDDQVLNNPYSIEDSNKKIIYSSFASQPKTLDPSEAYTSDAAVFTSQIYEPVIQYDYFARPLKLIPLTAVEMPVVRYLDGNGLEVDENDYNNILYTEFIITIKSGRLYQPHPAFARDETNTYYYHKLQESWYANNNILLLDDFPIQGTRELIADDYVYSIKRMAHPNINSPIYGMLVDKILGFLEFSKEIVIKDNNLKEISKLLMSADIEGVRVLNKYQYSIKVKGVDPQFIYWLAMNFFAPIPWEADVFYHSEYLIDKNITLDWHPIGTGPYMLRMNDPNRKMVLSKNPNHQQVTVYNPVLQQNIRIPIVDEAVYILEKEALPRWNKFLQGYYDYSSISSDSFDEAIKINQDGSLDLKNKLSNLGIKLYTELSPSIFYLAFNMLDPVVGTANNSRLLRKAIAMSIDYQEYISIFLNGRGIKARGPIPPSIDMQESIIGDNEEYNLAKAKETLALAGYPDGIDPKTNKPLVLNYDVPVISETDIKERLSWIRKQFNKLGIQLNIRQTHYNRFQDKIKNGDFQLCISGWHADYPDPENFLFLFYSKHGKYLYGGENIANYSNQEFDQLYLKMKSISIPDERNIIVNKMIAILQNDTPWVWGFHPKSLILSHQWNNTFIPSEISYNTLKYRDLNVELRNVLRTTWNKPKYFGVVIIMILIFGLCLLVYYQYRKRIYSVKYKKDT